MKKQYKVHYVWRPLHPKQHHLKIQRTMHPSSLGSIRFTVINRPKMCGINQKCVGSFEVIEIASVACLRYHNYVLTSGHSLGDNIFLVWKVHITHFIWLSSSWPRQSLYFCLSCRQRIADSAMAGPAVTVKLFTW